MTETYGDNFHIVWGDSKHTLKEARELMGDERCDFIVVDGDHSKNGVIADLDNFLKVASPGAVVFGDDCAPYKRTVPKSEEMLKGWMGFVDNGRIVSVANYRNPDLPSPGVSEPDSFCAQ
jgi:predicted O-methyltransferase YrrM